MTFESIQNLCTDIALHMLHILEQYVEGYITGVNTNRWKKHVLANSRFYQINFSTIFYIIQKRFT